MPSKLRPFRKRSKKKRLRLRLRPKLPQLWHNQRKAIQAMQTGMMQGSRLQSPLISRTAQPVLRLKVGARRIRRARIRISDLVFEFTQHSKS